MPKSSHQGVIDSMNRSDSPIIIDKYTEVKDGQSDAHDPESILAHATRKFVAMMQG